MDAAEPALCGAICGLRVGSEKHKMFGELLAELVRVHSSDGG
jgi:hypothetical protein